MSAGQVPDVAADRAAAERALESARLEVIRARACLAIWAAHDGPVRVQIRRTAMAAERAETELETALAQLPSGTEAGQ